MTLLQVSSIYEVTAEYFNTLCKKSKTIKVSYFESQGTSSSAEQPISMLWTLSQCQPGAGQVQRPIHFHHRKDYLYFSPVAKIKKKSLLLAWKTELGWCSQTQSHMITGCGRELGTRMAGNHLQANSCSSSICWFPVPSLELVRIHISFQTHHLYAPEISCLMSSASFKVCSENPKNTSLSGKNTANPRLYTQILLLTV